MQIRLRALGQGLALPDWERRAFTPGSEDGPRNRDHSDQYVREVGREPPGPPLEDGAFRLVEAAILRYEIFPPTLVSRVLRRVPVEPGDTVGIVYHAPLGIELCFAARVTERFAGPGKHGYRSGFTYRTLRGHPELGEETFFVEKDDKNGVVRVGMESWSRPGTLLASLFAPIVRRLQVGASAAALDHLYAIGATAPRAVSSGEREWAAIRDEMLRGSRSR